ncbi:MAG: RNA 2',3'-cyclic phosphodiesterase [Candidatus Omnitrophica bacterium]|nr:RNA 2',3'-cyclic phosphodiesterase [Candidatus Omnitrophota bacterium]
MRIFIAIALPKEIRVVLTRLQEELKKYYLGIKWVNPDYLHLTLMFLGEVRQDKISNIIQKIQEVAFCEKKVEVSLSQLGAFPNIRHPKVIWVGINSGEKEIAAIACKLQACLEKLKTSEEKDFACHITLGRVKSFRDEPAFVDSLSSLNENLCKEKLNFTADKIIIYKSTLTYKGPVYEALKEITLKAT